MNEPKYRESDTAFWAAHRLRPREHDVRLAATGTRVRIQELGEGPPILFLHGSQSAGSAWAPLLEHLHDFRFLVPDLPGAGASEPFEVRASSLDSYASRLVGDLLDGVGLDRAHVVASSFGGHVALRSAASDPGRFHRLVLMGCPALAPGETHPPFMRLLSNPIVRRLVAALPPSKRVDRSIFRQLGHGASLDAGYVSPAFLTWNLELQRHTDTHAHDAAMIADLVAAGARPRLGGDVLGSVSVRTLFLWGKNDPFGDESVARSVVQAMPKAELTLLPEAGHLPWLDDPRGVAQRVHAYLSRAVPGEDGMRL